MKAEQEQIYSVCTEFVFSLHFTAFIHSKQMRNSMLLQAQNNTVFFQLSSVIIWFICAKTKIVFSLPQGQSSHPFCS